MSLRINKTWGIDKVAVSGGCFQNSYLTNYIAKLFSGSSLKLFRHNRYPTTDLGISIGQAVIAANI
jgi:hydrogenase maturation protein HypF